MYKKSVMHVQSCCFAHKTYCFLMCLLPSTSLDLKVPDECTCMHCWPCSNHPELFISMQNVINGFVVVQLYKQL